MRTLSLYITKELSGKPCDSLLRHELFMSGTLIKQLRDGGRIYTDCGVCRTTDTLSEGQMLYADIDVDITYGKKPSFPILFENDDLLIIDKPSGMLCHATKVTYGERTVASELREYMGEAHFHPVNRLDRGTSGVMVIAKNGYTHNICKELLHTDKFIRTYRAVSDGVPKKKAFDITAPIGRDSVSPIKRVITPSGKPALTHVKVLSENGRYALLEIVPQTGRTHQIRLHMAYIGCPLVGDFLYGKESCETGRLALHSYSVHMYLPLERRFVDVTAEWDALGVRF